LESLETRLRALPPLPVPAELEACLLAAIPTEIPCQEPIADSSRRRWISWAGLAGALAAACLLVMLVWLRNHGKETELVKKNEGSSSNGNPSLNREARQDPGASLGTFNWPLEESSPMLASTAIPPDLLD
jgi:hypothetical protein